ncbi:MAG: hypothetical protein ACXW6T_18955, partial [Candidatus Binatia bacterium]
MDSANSSTKFPQFNKSYGQTTQTPLYELTCSTGNTSANSAPITELLGRVAHKPWAIYPATVAETKRGKPLLTSPFDCF